MARKKSDGVKKIKVTHDYGESVDVRVEHPIDFGDLVEILSELSREDRKAIYKAANRLARANQALENAIATRNELSEVSQRYEYTEAL